MKRTFLEWIKSSSNKLDKGKDGSKFHISFNNEFQEGAVIETYNPYAEVRLFVVEVKDQVHTVQIHSNDKSLTCPPFNLMEGKVYKDIFTNQEAVLLWAR